MMMLEETTHNGESVLSFLEAAAKGNVEKVMRSLHINPGLINTPHPETGSTALIAAAEENHSEVITLLLEHGADVTACNSANQTAVHVADDGVRAQLLSAVTRTSYPQLSMLQAAWQGDLGSVRHLLSTDPGQSVHTRNGQGLTPAMLVLRDVDLIVSVTMRHDYRPVEVLQELLTHNADADLLDSGGRSAFSYVSEVKNPLRRQLMDALERCAPPPDAHGEASCDLGIKPPLHDAPPAGVIQKRKSKEVSRDCPPPFLLLTPHGANSKCSPCL
ncbi:ankycorbin-like [Dendropsophus ebraccatus]|uniref:ankycorbin-like n=1 Tax=Dendropsophus ebraccatus TaxID=150705 RepID=UPI00383133DF